MSTDKMNSQLKYYKCEEVFGSMKIWSSVPEPDRRDIYDDAIFNLAKREKEEQRVAKKRNMKVLGELLESMANVTYSTTWSEAQVMLLENASFKNDVSLLGMDKEDALIVFEDHIRMLEKLEEQEKEREKKRAKRQQRKNRDAFLTLLDSLHEEGKLTSMSLWVELYPLISADLRFSAMLGQSGSTPLDLFKFYVENLKSKFNDEKKIIKDILKEKQFIVKADTSFEEFATAVCEDKRSANLDAGNVKLTYNSMLEKAEAVEKERLKEESKRVRKLENEIKQMWLDANLTSADSYETAKKHVQDLEAFATYEGNILQFRRFGKSLLRKVKTSKKSKKNKKHKKRVRSSSRSSSYESDRGSDVGSPLEEIPHKKKKKDKKKKDRKRSLSPEGISNTSLPSNGSSRLHEEQALSESELVSKRAALLAQLNEQID
uniref:FF domain-containing protein n=1 Tax=Megaselia scalaris TaxID=36166 RepID=T1GV23_MEGSC